MTNKQIARTFKLTADLIELTGGNSFRARAFAAGGRTVDNLEQPAADLVASGDLTAVQGIGRGLATDIEALLATGSFDTLDQLLAAVPPGLLDVLRLKGLGPKRARILWTGLGITSLDDLEEAALTGRISDLDGFGKKSEEKLLEQIKTLRGYMRQRHHASALGAVEPVLVSLRESEGVERAEPAGGLRRCDEVLSEAELVVAGDRAVIDSILEGYSSPAGDAVAGTMGERIARVLPDGLPLIVHLTPITTFDSVWWRRTGSEQHVAAFEREHQVPAGVASEAAIYERASMDWIPPELRENRGELEAARLADIPELIEVGDLKGTVHNHTTASDGAHTLREMADAARAMGYEYLGLCDHSQSLVIANGLTVDRLRKQGDEIRALNEELLHDGGPPFRILHGSEVDIMGDGSLDFPDDVLAELDLVVASVHTRFGMSEREATERIIRAVEHPLVDILGHPTGRLLLRRDGYPVDHDAIIEACARYNVAIELNANPYRLDVDWRFIRKATTQGVSIAINPDAHSIDELRYVQHGVAVARKGWLTAEQCLNARTSEEFVAWLVARRADRAD